MKKFKLYYDKDKEEAFLNDMSAKGYAMKRFFWGCILLKNANPVNILTGLISSVTRRSSSAMNCTI
jgi:hypothetical protein